MRLSLTRAAGGTTVGPSACKARREELSAAKSLSERLRQLAHARSQLSASQLQVINLGTIAASFGERRSEANARVFGTALHFLKKRLAEYDTLIPCSDGFIVIFGEDEGPAAALAGLRLTEALNRFFRRKPDAKHLPCGVPASVTKHRRA